MWDSSTSLYWLASLDPGHAGIRCRQPYPPSTASGLQTCTESMKERHYHTTFAVPATPCNLQTVAAIQGVISIDSTYFKRKKD